MSTWGRRAWVASACGTLHQFCPQNSLDHPSAPRPLLAPSHPCQHPGHPLRHPGHPRQHEAGCLVTRQWRLREALGWAPSRKALPTPVHSSLTSGGLRTHNLSSSPQAMSPYAAPALCPLQSSCPCGTCPGSAAAAPAASPGSFTPQAASQSLHVQGGSRNEPPLQRPCWGPGGAPTGLGAGPAGGVHGPRPGSRSPGGRGSSGPRPAGAGRGCGRGVPGSSSGGCTGRPSSTWTLGGHSSRPEAWPWSQQSPADPNDHDHSDQGQIPSQPSCPKSRSQMLSLARSRGPVRHPTSLCHLHSVFLSFCLCVCLSSLSHLFFFS